MTDLKIHDLEELLRKDSLKQAMAYNESNACDRMNSPFDSNCYCSGKCEIVYALNVGYHSNHSPNYGWINFCESHICELKKKNGFVVIYLDDILNFKLEKTYVKYRI